MELAQTLPQRRAEVASAGVSGRDALKTKNAAEPAYFAGIKHHNGQAK